MIDPKYQSEAVLDGRFGAGGVRGAGKPYVSPHGKIAGLADRLHAFQRKLRMPGHHLPLYGGLIADLEVVLRFLNATEFAEWLKVHGDDEQARWADEILAALDGADENEALLADIERVVPVGEGQAYADAVGDVAAKALKYDLVRLTLERVGALAPGDTDTDVGALLEALLA